jgi:hypothetical protein
MPHPTFVAAQSDYIARLNDGMRALDRRLAQNIAINGDMQVWQRGTAFSSSATARVYTADRWHFVRSGFALGASVSRAASGLAGFQYSARVGRDSGNASTAIINFAQSFETSDVTQLQGLPLFMTFRARAGANYSSAGSALGAYMVSGTGTDGNILTLTAQANEAAVNVTLTTSWQTFTLPISSFPSTKTQFALQFLYAPVGTAGVADYFEITGVQVVVGTMAGDMIYTPFAETLERCQRYYWKTFPYGTAPAQNAGNAGALQYSVLVAGVNAHRWQIPLPRPIPASVTPTVTAYNPLAANANWRNTTDAADSGASTLAMIGDRAVQVVNAGAAGDGVGDVCQIHLSVDADL